MEMDFEFQFCLENTKIEDIKIQKNWSQDKIGIY
jgi:hypothetical protein